MEQVSGPDDRPAARLLAPAGRPDRPAVPDGRRAQNDSDRLRPLVQDMESGMAQTVRNSIDQLTNINQDIARTIERASVTSVDQIRQQVAELAEVVQTTGNNLTYHLKIDHRRRDRRDRARRPRHRAADRAEPQPRHPGPADGGHRLSRPRRPVARRSRRLSGHLRPRRFQPPSRTPPTTSQAASTRPAPSSWPASTRPPTACSRSSAR